MLDALTGVRVLDFSRLLPGPLASRWLAEHGAQVIKVEHPAGGDMTRWVPPLVGEPPRGSLFDLLNAHKRSVALNLSAPSGRAAARALAETADVVFESFRPGVLAKYGLDAATLRAQNPRLVFVSLSGFGQTGPDAARAGHDVGYLARSGALGLASGQLPAVQVADVGGSLAAVAAIALALFRRERTGEGATLDLSLSDAALAFGATAWGRLWGGETPRPGEELLDGSRPAYTIYECADGHLAVGALEPKFWASFCATIDRPDLVGSGLDGGERGAAVRAEVQAILRNRRRDEWVDGFRGRDACVEPVLLPHEAAQDPHHRARGAVAASGFVPSPTLGATSPPSFAMGGAPALGEGTRELLEGTALDPAVVREVLDALGGSRSS